jgi:hypothetical protein
MENEFKEHKTPNIKMDSIASNIKMDSKDKYICLSDYTKQGKNTLRIQITNT